MSALEFLLAWATEIRWVFYIPATISSGIFILVFFNIDDGEMQKFGAHVFWKNLSILLISLCVLSVPTVDTLWKVRIGLIKLSLASPTNIEKGSEVIERIGHKLECKYLGCKDDK